MPNLVTQIIIRARDEASSVFGSLQTKTTAVAAAIAGAFGIKLFSDAVSSARSFESAMSAVQAAAGASGDELTALRNAAEEAGATTKYTSVEAANALENLAKSGLSASQAVQSLPAVLSLAQAGGVGLAEAADYITKAVNGMGLSFSEAGRVADVLAMGANASNTSVEGLAGALSYAAPLANSLGLSLEQTVAIIGKFSDAGIDASRAGTALNSILAQFADPASKFRQELAATGITTGDFDQALRQLAAAGPNGQRAISAVGQEAGPALRALLNQGIGSLDALKAKLDESAGSAATFAKVMGDNLDGATKGFGSAWDALLIKVGTPVLDTLKSQINAVSERLRGFVTDGTASAFGNAIKTAFESAGKWVAEFVGKVDFTQVAANLQAFASRVGEVFAAIGTHATTAGNILQTAYGVMSAGVNTVMAAVYALGQGVSWLTSAFLSDLALITEGLAKITFGDMSRGFANAAASMRTQARATYAVYQEFGVKAGEAFDAATRGATRAQEGWGALTGSAASASSAVQASAAAASQSIDALAEKTGLSADQFDALGANATVAGGKVVESATAQQEAAQATQVEIQKLREEYARAIEAGDTQTATEKLVALKRLLKETGDQASTTAAELELAFQNLGVTSQAELDRLASSARRSFEQIRDSGTATPRELQAAFMAYAKKAIEANGGVASEALKAEASIYKVRLEADETGQAIVRAMAAGESALEALGNKADEAAAKVANIQRQASGLKDVWDENGNLINGPQKQNYRNGGSAPVLGILNRAEQLGGLEYRKQLEDQAAQYFRRKGPRVASFGIADYNDYWQRISDQLDAKQIQKERETGRPEATRPQVVDQQPREQVTTYRVQIGTGAGRTQTINTASRQDADALVALLRQLEADALRS